MSARIDVVVSGKVESNSIKEVQKQIRGLTSSAHEFHDAMAGKDGPIAKSYAIVAANIASVTAAFMALRDASKQAILEKGLEIQSAKTGTALRGLAKDVQAITKYSISYKEAMEATALVSSTGFAKSAKITRDLTTAAANSAIGLGRNMTDAMDRMIKGVVKLEPELLDELGIMTKLTEATDKYARSIGKSASSLTNYEKRVAFSNAVLAENEAKFGGLIDKIDTNAYDKLGASVADLSRDFGGLLNTAIYPFISALTESKVLLGSVGIAAATSLAKMAAPGLFDQQLIMKDRAESRLKEITKVKKELDLLHNSMSNAQASVVSEAKSAWASSAFESQASVAAARAKIANAEAEKAALEQRLENIKEQKRLNILAIEAARAEQIAVDTANSNIKLAIAKRKQALQEEKNILIAERDAAKLAMQQKYNIGTKTNLSKPIGPDYDSATKLLNSSDKNISKLNASKAQLERALADMMAPLNSRQKDLDTLKSSALSAEERKTLAGYKKLFSENPSAGIDYPAKARDYASLNARNVNTADIEAKLKADRQNIVNSKEYLGIQSEILSITKSITQEEKNRKKAIDDQAEAKRLSAANTARLSILNLNKQIAGIDTKISNNDSTNKDARELAAGQSKYNDIGKTIEALKAEGRNLSNTKSIAASIANNNSIIKEGTASLAQLAKDFKKNTADILSSNTTDTINTLKKKNIELASASASAKGKETLAIEKEIAANNALITSLQKVEAAQKQSLLLSPEYLAASAKRQAAKRAYNISNYESMALTGASTGNISEFFSGVSKANRAYSINNIRKAREATGIAKAYATATAPIRTVAATSSLAIRGLTTGLMAAIPVVGEITFALGILWGAVEIGNKLLHPSAEIISKYRDELKETKKVAKDAGEIISKAFSNETFASDNAVIKQAQALKAVGTSINSTIEAYKNLKEAKDNAAAYDAEHGIFANKKLKTDNSSLNSLKDAVGGKGIFGTDFMKSDQYSLLESIANLNYAPLNEQLLDLTVRTKDWNKLTKEQKKALVDISAVQVAKNFESITSTMIDVETAFKEYNLSAQEFQRSLTVSTPFDKFATANKTAEGQILRLRSEMAKGVITAAQYAEQINQLSSVPGINVDTTSISAASENYRKLVEDNKKRIAEAKAAEKDAKNTYNSRNYYSTTIEEEYTLRKKYVEATRNVSKITEEASKKESEQRKLIENSQEAIADITATTIKQQDELISKLQEQHVILDSQIASIQARIAKESKYASGTANGIIEQAKANNKIIDLKKQQLNLQLQLAQSMALQTKLQYEKQKAELDAIASSRKATTDAIKERLKGENLVAAAKTNNYKLAVETELLNAYSTRLAARDAWHAEGSANGWDTPKAKELRKIAFEAQATEQELANLKGALSRNDEAFYNSSAAVLAAEAAYKQSNNSIKNIQNNIDALSASATNMQDAIREASAQAASNLKEQFDSILANAKAILDITESTNKLRSSSLVAMQQEMLVSINKNSNELKFLNAQKNAQIKVSKASIDAKANYSAASAASKEAAELEANKLAIQKESMSIEEANLKISLAINIAEKAKIDIYKEGIDIQKDAIDKLLQQKDLVTSIADKQHSIAVSRAKLYNLRAGGTGELSDKAQKAISYAEAARAYKASQDALKLRLSSIDAEYALLEAQKIQLQYELEARKEILKASGGDATAIRQIVSAISSIQSIDYNKQKQLAKQGAYADNNLAKNNYEIAKSGYYNEGFPGRKTPWTDYRTSKDIAKEAEAALQTGDRKYSISSSVVSESPVIQEAKAKAANDELSKLIPKVFSDAQSALNKLPSLNKSSINISSTVQVWNKLGDDVSAIRSVVEKNITNTSGSFSSDSDREKFAKVIASEAAGSRQSMIDVASSVMNRVKQSGKGLSDILIPSQYEVLQNGRANNVSSDKLARALIIADDVMSGKIKDSVNGANHFFSKAGQKQLSEKDGRAVIPKWADPSKHVVTREGHSFYKLAGFVTGKSGSKANLGATASAPIYTKDVNTSVTASLSDKTIGTAVNDNISKVVNLFSNDKNGLITSASIDAMNYLAESIKDLSAPELLESIATYTDKFGEIAAALNEEWVAGQGSLLEQLKNYQDIPGGSGTFGMGSAIASAAENTLKLLSPSGALGSIFDNKGKSITEQGKEGLAAMQGDRFTKTTVDADGNKTTSLDMSKYNTELSKAPGYVQKAADAYGPLTKAAEVYGSVSSSIMGIVNSNFQRNIANIDAQIAAEQRRDGKSAESVAKIKALEAKKESIAKKNFELNKKIQLGTALINTATAVTATLAQGGALAIPLAVAVGAMGAAQVALIASQQYQSAGTSTSAVVPNLSIGKVGSSVNLGKGANASAGGELGYLRGQLGVGNNANNYRTIGSAYGGNPLRGYGNRGIVVGEKGPELLEVLGGTAQVRSNAELQQMSSGNSNVIHATINAVDSESFAKMAKDNPGALIESVRAVANIHGQSFMENIDTRTYRNRAGRL